MICGHGGDAVVLPRHRGRDRDHHRPLIARLRSILDAHYLAAIPHSAKVRSTNWKWDTRSKLEQKFENETQNGLPSSNGV